VNVLLLTSLGFERQVERLRLFLEDAGNAVTVSSRPPAAADLRAAGIDLVVCHQHGTIIPAEVIAAVSGWVVNLHPSLLPHCRGLHPTLWSLATRAPLGVSLHFIDATIDTGPLIAQAPVTLDLAHVTLRAAHQALQAAVEDLFIAAWPSHAQWQSLAFAQQGSGTYFGKKAYARLKAAITTWDMPVAEFIRRVEAGPEAQGL
jgi:methionyl-tRNA formyltransferase